MMSFFRKFPGGIHPVESIGGKAVTSKLSIVEPPFPSRVIIPLHQNVGSPSRCVVEKGEVVRVGQLIGEPTGSFSAAVHASVSGKVAACEPCLLPNGKRAPCVIILNDYKDTWVDMEPVANHDTLTARQLADVALHAGIVGMGGAMFPYGVKLAVPEGKKIDTLILNGAECETYLSADHRMMLEHAKEIIKGALLIKNALKIDRILIGIENNKPDALETMKQCCEPQVAVEVVPLPVRYPQGGEKQLIHALTNRVVTIGGLPMDCGVLVCNVSSVFALYQAVYLGKPVIDRVITVAGCVQEPANYRVRIGTPVEWLVETAGGFLPKAKMLIYGGAMMGQGISRQDIPINKGCSGITALMKAPHKLNKEGPCIRCGRCVEACPMKLAPASIDRFMRKDMFEETEKLYVLSCIECGICSWVCPAKRNLTQSCKVCKMMLAQRKKATTQTKKEAM